MISDATAAPRRRLSFNSATAALLVIAEYVGASFAFDSQPLSLRADGWKVVGYLGEAAAMMLVAAGALALVALRGRTWRAFWLTRPIDGGALALLAGNAASFAVFWILCALVFGRAQPPAGPPLLWLTGLLLATGLSVLLAVLAAMPAAQGRGFVRRGFPWLAGGLLIGAGAFVAARGARLLWPTPLGGLALHGAARVLGLIAGPVFCDPAQALLGTARFQVVVAPECAGFEGVGLASAFVGGYLVLARRELRFPRALWLVPIGVGAAWIANLARIVSLVLVGSFVSEEIAVRGFHAKAGWLLFCALGIGLVALARRSPYFTRQPAALDLAQPTAAYLVPFLALVAVALVTGLGTEELDFLYGARVLTAAFALHHYRVHYRDPDGAGFGAQARRWGISAVALGLAAFALFVVLSPRPEAEVAGRWLAQWQALPLGARILWLGLRLLGSVLVVPVAEELAFRGYLLRRLLGLRFEEISPARTSAIALAISSLAFGWIHGGLLAGTAAGLLFGLAQRRGGSVGCAIGAHVVANAAVAIYVIAFHQWWIWM